jgi:hypothetical protein
MFVGSALFILFFGLAFWPLIFVMGFIGLWAQWSAVEMIKAKFAKKGFDEEV